MEGSNNDTIIAPIYENILQRKSLEESEKLFYNLTGIKLKDFLYKKYCEEGQMPYEIAKFFKCSPPLIFDRIKKYGFSRNISESIRFKAKGRKKEGRYSKTPIDIENETGRKFEDIITEMLNNGLSVSEISRKLELTNQTHIRKYIKQSEYKNQPVIYPNIFKQKTSIDKIEQVFYEMTGFILKDFLYQKHIEDNMSADNIASLFGTNSSTIHQKLKLYGINRSMKEARNKLIENGDINYQEIIFKSRKTARKSISKSNSQDFARNLFKEKIEEFIMSNNLNYLEVIIGYNEWCIIKNKEVDIPIIIIDTRNNNISKYAIEYNGDYWHLNSERDRDKANTLNLTGWIYKSIKDNLSNIRIEEQISEIVREIFNEKVSI